MLRCKRIFFHLPAALNDAKAVFLLADFSLDFSFSP
jgi:hypothetical protein